MTHESNSPTHLLAYSIILVLTSFGCAASLADEATPEITGQFAGLSYVETLTGGADVGDELPMLIALHYMTGSPATSIEHYGGVDVPARLLSLEGPYEFEEGFSWFPDGYYELEAASQAEITVSIADRIASFIQEATEAFPTRGKPILTGYSQGADLTHVIALREPELILAGLPMGGRFRDDWPAETTESTELLPTIILFHGATDTAVNVSESLAAATYYAANGVTVVLNIYAGVGHAYPVQMKKDFQNVFGRLVQSAAD